MGKLSDMKTEQDRNEEAKRLRERYIILRRRMETCKEVKPESNPSNTKDISALEYYKTCKEAIDRKVSSIEDAEVRAEERYERDKALIENSFLKAKERYERELQRVENTLKQSKAHTQLRREKESSHQVWVEENIKRVEERMEANKKGKTKEEIALTKELQDIIQRHGELQPHYDLNYAFPNYKAVFNLQPPTEKETAPPPNQSISYEKQMEFQQIEKQHQAFTAMTPWERLKASNPRKTYSQLLEIAKSYGIEEDKNEIVEPEKEPEPEPEKPVEPPKSTDVFKYGKRVSKKKVATETISREELSKILPNY